MIFQGLVSSGVKLGEGVGWIVSVKEIRSEIKFFNKQRDNNANALFL